MNHQVMISFDVDDKAVSEKIVEAAAKQIADKVIGECFGTKNGYDYYDRAKRNMNIYVKSIVKELLDEDRDSIVHDAVKETVKNISRTKQVKDALAEAI